MALSYLQTVLGDSPNALWTLSETSGTFADSTGNTLTATAHGSITRSVDTGFAGVGKGVSFGGTTSDYIDVANNALLNPTSALSYECWVKFSSVASFQTMMCKGGTTGNDALGMRLDTAAKIELVASFNGTLEFTGTNALSSATWYHIVFTLGTGPVFTTYINGVQDKQASVGFNPVSTTNTFNIGIFNTGSLLQPLTNGSAMAMVAVYPSTLSSTQVANHYNARNSLGGGSKGGAAAANVFVAGAKAGQGKTKGPKDQVKFSAHRRTATEEIRRNQ